MATTEQAQDAHTTGTHPLDPLTAAESAAAELLRREGLLTDEVLVVSMTLDEPAKEAVLGHRDGDAVDRRAFAVLRDRARKTTVEAVVSVSRGVVEHRRDVPGAQPGFRSRGALRRR